MPVIAICDPPGCFGSFAAVDSISLTIHQNENICRLFGPSCAGKTIALLMLTMPLQPISGTATVNESDIRKEPDRLRASIGIVFKEMSPDETLTEYENNEPDGLLYDMMGGLRQQRIPDIVALVELRYGKDDPINNYSGGSRRSMAGR